MYMRQVRSVAWNVPDDFLVSYSGVQPENSFLSFPLQKIFFLKSISAFFLTEHTHSCISGVHGTF